MAADAHLALAIVGADGRMGQEVLACALDHPRFRPGALLTRSDSPHLGEVPAGCRVAYSADLADGVAGTDVIVDFSAPAALEVVAQAAATHRVPLVSGTTGLDTRHRQALARAGEVVPVFYSPNMSVGVFALERLLSVAAQMLGKDYDIEVVESHHRHKKDAPSGTAKRLSETLREGVASVPGRSPHIPVHSIRGGDVVGDHTVHFMGDGDRIEITHRATARRTFAVGALRAALWLVEQQPGLYGMGDLLGGLQA